MRSSRALNHYTSLEDLSSLSSNSMVLLHPCSVSPHSQHSPLLYYRNKHHVLNWELRFETGTDSEISSLAAIQRLKFSLTVEPVAILKPHSFSVCCWCRRWNCGWLSSETWKELWCTFYFIFLKLDRTCGLGDFVSVLIKWEDFPQMSLLKEYYTNLQKNKGLKRDHFLFLVSCISAIYFGILKTKLMTSAYRYYWLCTLSTLLVCSANNWCIRKI